MDQGPLVTEQIDEGANLALEFEKYIPLDAVFWLKDSESGDWYLYLASKQINDTNFDLAYGEIHRIFSGRSTMWLDPFQVKVASVDDPTVRAVIEIMQKYPGRLPTHLRHRRLGPTFADEALIYPMPVSITA